MNYRAGVLLALIAVVVFPAGPSRAADYPTKPITLINPNAPGGGHDAVARAFATVAEKMLGQPVVVINKAGASTMLGMTAVAGRKPPLIRADLVPIGGLTVNLPLIIVPTNSPWKTVADMVKDLKAKPGFYAFCSGGLYGGTHLPVEVLLHATGTKARHVPHKGGGPCLTAVVGEHVHFASQWPASSIPLAQGKKLRILAVQGDKRLKSIPGAPPNLLVEPKGCPFAPRCEYRVERCHTDNPTLSRTSSPGPGVSEGLVPQEHRIACWVDVNSGDLR